MQSDICFSEHDHIVHINGNSKRTRELAIDLTHHKRVRRDTENKEQSPPSIDEPAVHVSAGSSSSSSKQSTDADDAFVFQKYMSSAYTPGTLKRVEPVDSLSTPSASNPIPVFDVKTILEDISKKKRKIDDDCHIGCYDDEPDDDASSIRPTRAFCFMCKTNSLNHDGTHNTHVSNIQKLIKDLYNTTTPGICVNTIDEYYHSFIRYNIPMAPAWEPETILEHIERHQPSALIAEQIHLRTFALMSHRLETDGLMFIDPMTNKTVINTENMKQYIIIVREKARIQERIIKMTS
jgi:hypothetical protein